MMAKRCILDVRRSEGLYLLHERYLSDTGRDGERTEQLELMASRGEMVKMERTE